MKKLSELLELVEVGERFSVNFKTGKMGVSDIALIDSEGNILEDIDLEEFEASSQHDAFTSIEMAYTLYANAFDMSDKDSHSRYFIGRTISGSFIVDGYEPCKVSSARLEIVTNTLIARGTLTWDGLDGKFFWKSENEPTLYVFKEWITKRTSTSQSKNR